MKIILCQINQTVGDLENNRIKILDYYNRAKKLGADLVVFPEMTITGYPPQDLLYQHGFVESNQIILEDIAMQTTIPVILGFVRKIKGRLHNSAALCSQGSVNYIYDKMLLPTYDVFDEDRYFEAGKVPGMVETIIAGKSVKIGIQICEDLWDEHYNCNIVEFQKSAGAELIINISASPYHEGRLPNRKVLIEKKVAISGIPFIYCNLVGAQDELIFDGQSLVLSGDGKLLGQGKIFEEDLICVDFENPKPIQLPNFSREEKIYQALCLGVKDYFAKTGHKEAVIGLSGGIDSSLVACIGVDALGAENMHGVSMPSKYSSEHSKDDAAKLAQNIQVDYDVLPIDNIVKQFKNELKQRFKGTKKGIAEENIQARARGTLLMALSNKFNWLVLATGNKTEMALGYCTLYGDMNGGLMVISDLSKIDVYALSQWVNEKAGYERIPNNCILKPPSAELSPNQIDPFDYNVVSPLVSALVEDNISPDELIKKGADASLIQDIMGRIRINEFKRRQAAPGLRITSKAFGMGRRFPIVNHYYGFKYKK